MEQFVKEKSESEGHFQYYPERNSRWNEFVKDDLKLLCDKLKVVHTELFSKWQKKKEASLNFRIDWTQRVKVICDEFCVAREDIHLRIIITTVAKYALKYIQEKDSLAKPTSNNSMRLPAQSESGIKMLSGGILGKMFKLYKKDRKKYAHHLGIMKLLIVVEKTKVFIPVEQRCRDNGGLYIMKDEFIQSLTKLDKAVREEFVNLGQHGYNIIKVRMHAYIRQFCLNSFLESL